MIYKYIIIYRYMYLRYPYLVSMYLIQNDNAIIVRILAS